MIQFVQHILQFTVLNWPQAILLPWLAWEFQRRYIGNKTLLISIPFVLFPPFSWIYAYVLFTKYNSTCAIHNRKLNRAALLFSFSLLVPPVLLACTYAILMVLMTILRDSHVVANVLLVAWCLFVLSSIYIPVRVFKRFRSLETNRPGLGNPLPSKATH